MAFRQAKLKSTNLTISTTTAAANPHSIQTTLPPSNNSNRSGTIGYAPDAAWLAIRRHMQIGSFDEHMVRKNIRLDSSSN